MPRKRVRGEKGEMNVGWMFAYPGNAFNSSAHVGLKDSVRVEKVRVEWCVLDWD